MTLVLPNIPINQGQATPPQIPSFDPFFYIHLARIDFFLFFSNLSIEGSFAVITGMSL